MLNKGIAILLILILLILGCSAVMASAESTDISQEANIALSDEQIKEFMSILGEELYYSAYEELKAGAVLSSGSNGDSARALQTILRALGEDIAVDGAVGPKTLGALAGVQERFRLEVAQEVDEGVFSSLICIAAIRSDVQAAGAVLTDIPEDKFEYWAGHCALLNGNNYQAWKHFTAIGEQEAAGECELPMPEGDELYRSELYRGRDLGLNISSVQNICVKIYSAGELVSAVFVPAGQEVSVGLSAGSYTIRTGTGDRWFGYMDGFGEDGEYRELELNGMIFEAGKSYNLEVKDALSQDGTVCLSWEEFRT